MENKKLFEKYHSRLVWEGFFKALICGLIVGFFVNFVVAFIMWFVEFPGLWLSIGIGIAAVAASTPIFYFAMFRPTTKQIATRIDRLGLEERILTMHELENDDSYIAMRQREDAKAQLKKAESEEKKIKFNIFTKKFFTSTKIVAATLAVVLGVSMTTVTGLHDAGIIGSGKDITGEIIDNIIKGEPVIYDITYGGEVELPDEEGNGSGSYIDFEDAEWDLEAGGGGYFVGQTEQNVESGETSENILAVGSGGENGDWAFSGWSDGNEDPSRSDIVTDTTDVTASFDKLENPVYDYTPGFSLESSESDQNGDQEENDRPPEPNNSNNSSSNQPNNSNSGNQGSTSDINGNDKIINNETDYRDVFGPYYEEAMEYIKNGQDLPPDLLKILEAYFATLNK